MRRLIPLVIAGLLTLATAIPALADQPPGQLGYAGRPGNQN